MYENVWTDWLLCVYSSSDVCLEHRHSMVETAGEALEEGRGDWVNKWWKTFLYGTYHLHGENMNV